MSFWVSKQFSRLLARLWNTEQKDRQTTPVHCSLTFNHDRRHIMLESQPNTSCGAGHAPSSCGESNDDHKQKVMGIILVVSRGHGNGRDLNSWRDWILNASMEATQVHLTRSCDAEVKRWSDDGYQAASSPAHYPFTSSQLSTCPPPIGTNTYRMYPSRAEVVEDNAI